MIKPYFSCDGNDGDCCDDFCRDYYGDCDDTMMVPLLYRYDYGDYCCDYGDGAPCVKN